jgi:hypothetical protein
MAPPFSGPKAILGLRHISILYILNMYKSMLLDKKTRYLPWFKTHIFPQKNRSVLASIYLHTRSPEHYCRR